MNLKTASEVLKNLRRQALQAVEPDRRLAAQVAARRLEADLTAAMDQLCRLQVLEGVAGVHPGLWTDKKNPLLMLPKVADQFKGTQIDPSWLQAKPTGMYRLLHRTLDTMLARSHVTTTTADDLLQMALAGIGSDGERETKRVLHETGRYLDTKIKDGEETPMTVAGGLAGQHLKRKALNEINKLHRQQELIGPTVQDDSSTGGVGGYDQWTGRYQIEVLTEAMLDLHDPVGQAIRNAMRASWAGTSAQRYMDRWVDLLEETGEKPRLRTIADEFGVREQSLTRPFQQAMEHFKDRLDSDEHLQSLLEEKYRAEGVLASVKRRVASRFAPVALGTYLLALPS